MDLYKKHSTEIRTKAIAAVSDQATVEATVPVSDESKADEELVLSPVQETSNDTIQTFNQEDEKHEEQSEEAANNTEEPIPMVTEEMDDPKPEKSMNGDESCFPFLGNSSSQTAPAMAMSADDDDNNVTGFSKTDAGDDNMKNAGNHSTGEDGDGDGDGIPGSPTDAAVSVLPSYFPDGSPKECEAIVPESNESSKSVILSRIHHSPESTH